MTASINISYDQHRWLAERAASIPSLNEALVFVQKFIRVDHIAFAENFFSDIDGDNYFDKWESLPKSVRVDGLFDYICEERKWADEREATA